MNRAINTTGTTGTTGSVSILTQVMEVSPCSTHTGVVVYRQHPVVAVVVVVVVHAPGVTSRTALTRSGVVFTRQSKLTVTPLNPGRVGADIIPSLARAVVVGRRVGGA